MVLDEASALASRIYSFHVVEFGFLWSVFRVPPIFEWYRCGLSFVPVVIWSILGEVHTTQNEIKKRHVQIPPRLPIAQIRRDDLGEIDWQNRKHDLGVGIDTDCLNRSSTLYAKTWVCPFLYFCRLSSNLRTLCGFVLRFQYHYSLLVIKSVLLGRTCTPLLRAPAFLRTVYILPIYCLSITTVNPLQVLYTQHTRSCSTAYSCKQTILLCRIRFVRE